jgi:AraC-like DNA-binding protein
MSMISMDRLSDSPYVEMIMHAHTTGDGSTVRPAECHWHMVFVRARNRVHTAIVGPLTASGVASWGAGAEILWIKFKLGTYMPQMPVRGLLDRETFLPEASSRSFWLKSSTLELPTYENVDTFVDRLVRDELLAYDPIVHAALQEQPLVAPPRTVRHRFLQTAGISQSHIRQFIRARQAAAMLRRGVSIGDTIYEAGYFDQPHLTRSLKRFIGKTPAQLLQLNRPPCHSIQDIDHAPEYTTHVLESR